MAAPRNRKHFIVTLPSKQVPFVRHDKDYPPKNIPVPNRASHGYALKTELRAAVEDAQKRRAAAEERLNARTEVPGLYVQFESVPDVPLNVESLEVRRGKDPVEVVAFTEEVRLVDGVERRVQKATVFVPDGKVKQFIDRFDKYEQTPTANEPADSKRIQRHHDAFDRVAALRLATLKALWTDDASMFPQDDTATWWEVWLRRASDDNEAQRFRAFAQDAGITLNDRALRFDDRTILLAKASASVLGASLDVLDSVAELRAARPLSTGVERLTNVEQREYADTIADRVQRPAGDRPAVCILDTGVNRAHPLLAEDLRSESLHTINAAWGTADDVGHGTEMAGLALLGDLTPLMLGTDTVDVLHQLESVKVLRKDHANKPELYGALTAHAVSLPESTAPSRRRIFSMAITAPDQTDRGRPTLWSSAIDALAVGRSFDQDAGGNLSFLEQAQSRLLVVSAGNVDVLQINHLDRSDAEPVEDPAQAWNALTIGASTNLSLLLETDRWPGGQALAPPGELSPWSRTSFLFERKKWPIKPDVVFEGGNLVRTANGGIEYPASSLSVLTTSHEIHERLLTHSSGTSAATAQIARLGAQISARYPSLWPESIRGLIVHSAEWTAQMKKAFPDKTKSDRGKLLRRYGYGVPDEARALRSAADALTLIHQGTIHPFANGKMHEMNVHGLPWPKDTLVSLGASDVRLRVTLSYFIEPNPSRRGQTSRYRYSSHGLRFAMKTPLDKDEKAFRQRINKKDLDEGGKPDAPSDMPEWWLGEQRDVGSLHSDFWYGSAVALAERDVLAVYPVSGWWKDVPKKDRSGLGVRYSLIVSIETEAVGVDLWAEVAQKVGLMTVISV